MNAIVVCLLLLATGCFAAPDKKEESLPLSDKELTKLDGAIKLLAGGDYSRDDFSKPAQLFFWKVWKMSEIEGTYEELQSKLGLLKEDHDPENLLQKLDQQVLLTFVELPRKAQAELEDAMPALNELKDARGLKNILGEKVVDEICSSKTGNDAEQGLDGESVEPSDLEEE
ncbi:hypothetical protein AAVH_24253 [Aphelenchoides avenae]|nr:hypothetical protein AAVH_24253 [Aphelenchus avenae]